MGEAPAAAPTPDPNVVLSREDAIKTRHPAHKFSAVEVSGKDVASVRITTDGEVAKFGLVELKNPGRLALDLAHEIKQPLTAMSARVYTLQKLLPPGSDVLKDAATAQKNNVLVTPTLILIKPHPKVTVLGNLSDTRQVFGALRLIGNGR